MASYRVPVPTFDLSPVPYRGRTRYELDQHALITDLEHSSVAVL